MAQQLLAFESTLPPDDVTERAAVFFTNQRWRVVHCPIFSTQKEVVCYPVS
jgi:hypothetical protein